MNSNKKAETSQNYTTTGGGAYVEGDANIGNDLVGRDSITLNIFSDNPKELIQTVLSPSLLNRGEQWTEDIGNDIAELLNRTDLTLEQLQTNDPFISALLNASQLALKTGQIEKRESLRNAVINSTFEDAPDESLQQVFLHLIDQLTVWHLRILKLFSNPEKVANQCEKLLPQQRLVSSPSDVFTAIYPEIEKQGSIFWNDLFYRQLVDWSGQCSPKERKTTELGEQFLNFITKRL